MTQKLCYESPETRSSPANQKVDRLTPSNSKVEGSTPGGICRSGGKGGKGFFPALCPNSIMHLIQSPLLGGVGEGMRKGEGKGKAKDEGEGKDGRGRRETRNDRKRSLFKQFQQAD